MRLPILARQGLGYGLVGGLVLLVDWAIFVSCSALGAATIPANLAGRVVGALLGFWLNGTQTFRDSNGARLGWERFGRYAATWAVLSALSSLAMFMIDRAGGLGLAWLAKPVVDGILALLAFLLSRTWIYR